MALTIQMVTAALKEIAHVIFVETIERMLALLAKLAIDLERIFTWGIDQHQHRQGFLSPCSPASSAPA
ncbi:MAG: hypothetical protein ACKO9F_11695, partial [Caldilinea sp.]